MAGFLHTRYYDNDSYMAGFLHACCSDTTGNLHTANGDDNVEAPSILGTPLDLKGTSKIH